MMRDRKFTAGPWRVSDIHKTDNIRVVGDNDIAWWSHARVIVAGEEHMLVGGSHTYISKQKMGGFPTVESPEEMIANTVLMSAAPDLLEALELLLSKKLWEGNELSSEIAERAIAKAYGESHD